jgi:hypothetical protein
MARTTGIHLNSTLQLNDILESGRSFCSDHLGSFFQNKYSPPALEMNKFEIPAKLIVRNEHDCFAICVMMNNHITDLKYFSDIFHDWNNEITIESDRSEHILDKINMLVHDQRLLTVIQSFKKTNDEIVIGRCRGSEFTPI